MIEEKEGRAASFRTREEEMELLKRELGSLSKDEREVVELMLAEMHSTDDESLIDVISKVEYKHEPVDMRTFCLDKYYLGNTCDNIYPKLLDDLTELFAGGYNECIFTGSIGYGKTFAASIGITRILYELSCMVDPHSSFGLAKDSNISIVNLSVNETLAIKVIFENIATKVRASPYFQENFPFKVTKKELRFPGNVWVAARASTDSSALGLNVVAGAIDECVCAGSNVLLASGAEALVEALAACGEASLATFDFSRNEQVPAQAFIKRSMDQECYELTLSDGQVMRWGATHPVAVLRKGSLVFNELSDIIDGDLVVTYAPLDSRAQRSTRSSDAAALGRGPVCGQEGGVDRGAAVCGSRADEETSCGRETSRAPCAVWGEEPVIREIHDRGAQGEVTDSQYRKEGFRRDAPKDGRGTPRQADTLRGVQAGVGCEEQNASIQPLRGVEMQDQCVERVEDTQGELEVPWPCSDHEGRESWVPQYVGGEGVGDFRGSRRCSFVCVREAVGALYLGGKSSEDAAGLQDRACGWRCSDCGGEAPRLHLQQERAGKVDSRSEVLRGARLGIRGLGRTLSLARVVSKRRLGVLPTYAVDVPGYEVFVADSVLVHNTNFMHRSRQSKQISARHGLFDRAENLYAQIKRRMKSRFERHGQLPGILFLVSSKRTKDDFTARRVMEARDDSEVFVRDYALWDVKPGEYYATKKFWVLCGNEAIPSKIVDEAEELAGLQKRLPEGCVLMDVPADFKSDFERDLEGAIRDIAGVATVAVSPFIQRREMIDVAVDRKRQHPFSRVVYDPSAGGKFLWGKMISQASEPGLAGASLNMMRPRINPHALRHVHIDPSLTSDATGFCVAHIGGWTGVERRSEDGVCFTESAPVFVVDIVLQIVPPPGEELVLGDIRRLVYDLTEHGYSIACISMDSYQSADSLQQFSARGYNTELVSVDKTMDPYENMKLALYEGRLQLYEYLPLIDELQKLEHDRERNKVDHPPRGSKDVSDALAGCLFTLLEHRTSKPMPMLKSRTYAGDAWMEEQRHAMLAGQQLADQSQNLADTLPPFLIGCDTTDEWGS